MDRELALMVLHMWLRHRHAVSAVEADALAEAILADEGGFTRASIAESVSEMREAGALAPAPVAPPHPGA